MQTMNGREGRVASEAATSHGPPPHHPGEPRQSIFTKFCGLIWQAVAGHQTLVCERSPGSGGALVCILVEIQFGGGGREGGVPGTLDISYLEAGGKVILIY